MKKLFFAIILTLIALASVQTASAQYAPCPQYGAGECPPVVTIVVDKTVQNPSTKNFVDNLGANDPKYGPGQTVLFRVKVTNTGSTQIDNVTVTDTLPSYMKAVPTKGGTTNGNTFTVDVGTLRPGESKTFDVSAQVVDDKALPSDRNVICNITNIVDANSPAATAHDEASFCISHNIPTTTKGGMPVYPAPKVKETPKTGPEMLLLFGLMPTGAAGYILRRKTHN